MFWGSWPLTFLFFLFFLFVCLQKHCFPPEKGLFLFIFQCLTFFLLGFLHFSFSFPVSLSLSLSFSCLFFLSFLVFLFLFVTFLVFFAVLSCLVSLLLFHDNNNNITILDVKGFFFINLFCFFWVSCFLVFPIPFSYLCFSIEHECFRLSKQTISKTQILVLHFVKHYRFSWGPFCRQHLDDV